MRKIRKEYIGFKRKRLRLIAAIICAVLMLSVPGEPGTPEIVLIYEAIFAVMILLWLADYTDARIMHQAHRRAMESDK